MRRVAILGSTGSVGTQALAVAEALAGELEIVALAAGSNAPLLIEQAKRHRPRLVALDDAEAAAELREALADLPEVEVAVGSEGVRRVALCEEADIVLAAVVGAAGLPPLFAAVREGKDVALANKEALVTAGRLLVEEAARSGSRLLPVDSEHCGLHQCLRAGEEREVARLVLTASGGPFRELSAEELEQVGPEEALDHPNWSMGAKISIDSATLMNKGLEVIEARWLFDVPAERIEVVVHPQSLVHSFVEFRDGSLMAQVSATDMTLPIQYALTWPRRLAAAGPRLEPTELGRLDFEPPDTRRFPCLRLAYEALERGGGAPAVLNAANEVAVEAFLAGETSFPGIFHTVRSVLDQLKAAKSPADLDGLLALDERARAAARSVLREGS